MELTYKRNLSGTYLTIETELLYERDYQIRMLEENQIPGILPMTAHGMNRMTVYEYNISGTRSLDAMSGTGFLNGREIRRLVTQLIAATDAVKNYLLDESKLQLDVEYIFKGNDTYLFCYCPAVETDVNHAFHKLTEYLVREADYEDRSGIYLAYELHKMTMEPNYSLKEVWSCILEREESETAGTEEDQKDYPYEQEERIYMEGTAESTFREESGHWKNVREFLDKVRTKNWGQTDSFYMEEEIWDNRKN